jgi:hypothetical protein
VLVAALACGLLAAGCATPAQAIGNLATLDVIDRDTGQPLPVYPHRGDYYVAGQPGARYAIRLRNRGAGRLLTVVSVDGINVVSGEEASIAQGGYVLDPWQSVDIAGWRKSDAEVAAFEFTSLADSYAARTGRPRNVGVIGVAVFRERAVPAIVPSAPIVGSEAPRADGARAQAREEATAAGSASNAAQDSADARQRGGAPSAERLGTGHGARETSHVTRTRFVRASSAPNERLVVRYDSRENLIAAGVIAGTLLGRPRPFPVEPHAGYVPDPPPR